MSFNKDCKECSDRDFIYQTCEVPKDVNLPRICDDCRAKQEEARKRD